MQSRFKYKHPSDHLSKKHKDFHTFFVKQDADKNIEFTKCVVCTKFVSRTAHICRGKNDKFFAVRYCEKCGNAATKEMKMV